MCLLGETKLGHLRGGYNFYYMKRALKVVLYNIMA